jgi:hypothetical protein
MKSATTSAPARRAELVALRREALEAMNPSKDIASNEAKLDSGNSPSSVQ